MDLSTQTTISNAVDGAPQPQTSKVPHRRIEWLDALRGFTMLLVVMNHVFLMSFQGPVKYSAPMSLCQLFRMPLFFFVSGFLAYKVQAVWDFPSTGQRLWKKVQVQVVPTLVFMTVWAWLTQRSFWPAMETAWASPMKGGYWFTLVLLQMFIIYYLWCFLWSFVQSSNVGMEDKRTKDILSLEEGGNALLPLLLLWLLSLVYYATSYMPSWFTYPKSEWMAWTSFIQTVRYFHFFLFGVLLHRFWPQVQRLMDSAWFFPLVLVVAFWGAGDNLKWHILRLQWANLPRTLGMYALVLLVVMFFRRYAEWFSREHRVGRSLQYIGVRTLDIYLLHYLFLPNLGTWGPWFKAHPHNFVVDATVSLSMALLVVAFCLLTSHVLRISPFLKKWLFGRS